VPQPIGKRYTNLYSKQGNTPGNSGISSVKLRQPTPAANRQATPGPDHAQLVTNPNTVQQNSRRAMPEERVL